MPSRKKRRGSTGRSTSAPRKNSSAVTAARTEQQLGGSGSSRLTETLTRIWQCPPTLRCDFARSRAGDIAIAATHGYITCTAPDGSVCHVWLITVRGLKLVMKGAK